jgi:hypothetical protein
MTEPEKGHRVARAIAAARLFCKDNYPIIFGIVGGLTLALLVRR